MNVIVLLIKEKKKGGITLGEMELIQRAKTGDEGSLEELLQQNYSILKGYLLKVTLDPELAADLTQETMFKAIKKLRQFKGKSKFSTWLITIGSNLYRDYLKKNRRLTLVENLEPYQEVIYHEEADEQLILNELLAKLPSEKRMVLILKHYFGYNYQEISQVLKCPVGTVKSRMYYCLEYLQKEMKGGQKE